MPANKTGTVAENEFVHPNLQNVTDTIFSADPNDLPTNVTSRLMKIEETFEIPPGSTHVDARSGRIASLALAQPLIPGNGMGNNLGDNETRSHDEWSDMAVQAVQNWLTDNEEDLGVKVSELFATGLTRTAVHGENGDVIQIHLPRTFSGLIVVGSRASATIKAGNLINIGFERWGTIHDGFSVVSED